MPTILHNALTGSELHDPLGTSRVGALALPNNDGLALRWTDGAGNNVLTVNTTTGTPSIVLANPTTSPVVQIQGTGGISLGGALILGGSNVTHGSSLQMDGLEMAVTLSGTSVLSPAVFPANIIVVAVTARVTIGITGPASWRYGRNGDSPANRYGSALSNTLGTTTLGFDSNGPMQPWVTGGYINIQPNDGVTAFTGGQVRLCMYYFRIIPPAS